MQAKSSKVAARKSKGDMEGSSISEVERLRLDTKCQLPESKISLVWSEASDTNVGAWRYGEFKERTAQKDLSVLRKGMMKSRLVHVAGFPPAIQCYKLILECARQYDFDTQRVVSTEGRVLANFNPISIAQAFDMLDFPSVCTLNMDLARTYYENDPTKAQQMINAWLEKPKSHYSKLPKQLHRVKFRSDIYDAITLLSRVVGLKTAGVLEN